MRNKETGEFELVVGNGQLVSGFFIVVLLFAVGVAMGYILGQNSEKAVKTQQGDAVPCVATDGRPQPAQPAQQQQAAPQTPAATDAQPQGGAEAPPQTTTQPAKEPEPAPAKQEPAKQEPVKKEPVKKEPPPPAKSAPDSAVAPSGFFWQVAATSNQESARATLKVLRDKGFSAYLAPGPSNLTRVLVGPYRDTPSKARAKSEIEAMGLGKPVAHTLP
jgi:cell division septation protein DedD